MTKPINKQSIQAIQDGYTITWNRDQEGDMSAAEAGKFYVEGGKALEVFKKYDPRANPEARDAVKSFETSMNLGKLMLMAFGGGVVLVVLFLVVVVYTSDRTASSVSERDVSVTTKTSDTETTPAVEPRSETPVEAAAVAVEPVPGGEALERAKERIRQQVFDYLAQRTQVTLGTPEYRTNSDGTGDVLVPVSWEVDPGPVLAVLNRYFWDLEGADLRHGRVDFSNYSNDPVMGTVINRHYNEKKDRRTPHSEELLDWMSTQQMRIVVSVGDHSGSLAMTSGRSCFLACRGVGRDQYQLQFVHDAADRTVIFSNIRRERDPVVIASVPPGARDRMGQVVWQVRLEDAK